MRHLTLSGSCLCGAVTYQVEGDPKRFYHCHCARCRKATGTGHASNIFLQPGQLTWLSGSEHVRAFKVPEAERFTNQFCDVCGSRLPRQPEGTDIVSLPAGSLDCDVPIQPQARIFFDSRSNWSCQGDAIATYPEYAPQ